MNLAARPVRRSTQAERIAARAEQCLHLEIRTWPKPGLVSHVDTGSHVDMDAKTFRRSAVAIRPFLVELVEAGVDDRPMPDLRRIGLRAESAMRSATGGVNTHRGAIFGLGLLCAAAGMQHGGHADRSQPLGAIVARRWGREIVGGPRVAGSHGETAARRHGAEGAPGEAAGGFPSVHAVGVPALREGTRLAPGDPEAARVHACLALIATVDDTNLLHRGGADGLRFARDAATAFVARGGVACTTWRSDAACIHRAFVERNLSPGGAADLLAMSLFVRHHEDETAR